MTANVPLYHLPHPGKISKMSANTLPDAALNGNPSTKMLILCSNRPKMGVPMGKSAQKPRFCARKARKQGFQTPKAHKDLDFVLEMPKNRGSGGQKRTKTPILCSGREEIDIGKHNRRDAYRKRGLPENHRARFKNADVS